VSTAFTNTTRAVAADSATRDKLIISISLVLLLMWGGWFLLANITLYKTSTYALVKQQGQDIDLALTVNGKVKAVYAGLGQPLKKGDLILALDSAKLSTELAHSNTLLTQRQAQLKMLASEQLNLTTVTQLTLDEQHTKRQQLKQSLANLQNIADIQANIQQRHKALVSTQKSAQLEYLAAQKSYQQALVDLQGVGAQISQVEHALHLIQAQSKQSTIQLSQRRNTLEQQISQTQTTIQQQQIALDDYQLRAPQDGVMAAFTAIKPGQIIQAGQSVGTLLTAADMYVEAQFSPDEALGHVQVGQQARILVTGFAWTQYGSFNAKVTQVANAVQNNQLRVTLAIEGEQPPSLPLLHDAPVSVEVSTATVTPLNLVLQTAAVWLAPNSPSQASSQQQSGF
jgi:multidrug resistance efflux pump